MKIPSQNNYNVGKWASICTTIMVSFFGLILILAILKIDLLELMYITSIFIEFFFLITLIALNSTTSAEQQIWSRIAVSLGTLYATLCCLCYFLVLSVYRLNTFALSENIMNLFKFTPGSVTFSMDMLGYTFLTLSTLFLVPIFNTKADKPLKILLFIHGLLAIPTFIFPLLEFEQTPSAIDDTAFLGCLVNLIWCIIFLPILILITRYFNRQKTIMNSK